MDERLRQLGAEVARIQDEASPDGRRRAAVRNRLLQTSESSTRPAWRLRRPAIGLGLTAAALVAALFVWLRGPGIIEYRAGAAGSSSRVDEWIAAPVNSDLPIMFTDGSSIHLSPGSRARVRELSKVGAAVQLERGQATVHVVHRHETRWSVEAGPFVVHVIGTRFWVRWEPSDKSFGLQVLDGKVRVAGPGGTRTVTRRDGEVQVTLEALVAEPDPEPAVARTPNMEPVRPAETVPTTEPALAKRGPGVEQRPRHVADTQGLRRSGSPDSAPTRAQAPSSAPRTPSYRPPSGRLELKLPPKNPAIADERAPTDEPPPISEAPPAAEAPADEQTESEPDVPEAPAPSTEPAWKELVDEGAYEEALSTLSTEQLKEATRQGEERDLVNLAAVARRTGDPRARYIYSVVRSRFAGTDGAANAAFMIARMEFHAGAPQAAATWLEIYLRERPGGRFSREAAGRLIEAYVRAEDSTSAKAAAERYLALYPKGPHAALARSTLQ
ncbi:MAG: FecR domain-containing protein [Polyangiales bacterium]